MLFQRILGINRDTPWSVHYTSTIIVPQKIKIGKDVWKNFAVSGCCYTQGGNGIEIGDNTIFAPRINQLLRKYFLKRICTIAENPPTKINKKG